MTYTVQPGDTLWQIAQRFGLTLQDLLQLDPQITDPNFVYAGQEISVPVR